MSIPDGDRVHRTAKHLLESGQATSIAGAEAALAKLILQIDVGQNIAEDQAAQAAVMTAVNTAGRCFLGGVLVRIEDDPVLTTGWGRDERLSAVVARLGGVLTETLDPQQPTLVIGAPSRGTSGTPVMYTAWNGWAGGVLEGRAASGLAAGIGLAGVLAAAIGVCEVFQQASGSVQATRRDAGISLWDPREDWLSAAATGPELTYLPARMWLLGLGHLGQAYAWCLGLLPFEDLAAVEVFVMDTDTLITGNLSTGLLAEADDVGKLKTRLVAAKLKSLGFTTRIVERRFDENTWPTEKEPGLAFAGFDKPEPRRLLGGQFSRAIDAGLGGGVVDYLYLAIHRFPSQLDPAALFQRIGSLATGLPNAYDVELERLLADGADPEEARCGLTEIAGISVAASFVGAITATLVLAQELRTLHKGPELALLTLDLRTPGRVMAVTNSQSGPPVNLGFSVVARRASIS